MGDVRVVTRAELEALGWTDDKLEALYDEHVSSAPRVRLTELRDVALYDGPSGRSQRRERFDAVCARLYQSDSMR